MSSFLKLVGWVFSWISGRPELIIRIMQDNPEEEIGGLTFEVENRASKPTSLKPLITVNFMTSKGDPAQMEFDVRELDRLLQPFKPKLFSASAKYVQADRSHGWFRTYIFRPSNGPAAKVRIRNAHLDVIGALSFLIERNWFKLTGKVKGNGSTNINEYRAKKRSRGPH